MTLFLFEAEQSAMVKPALQGIYRLDYFTTITGQLA
jgi:hypothetical protein